MASKRKKTKPEIVDLPPTVSLWRRKFMGGVVTIFNEDSSPVTLERVNVLLDQAKYELMKELCGH